MDVLKQAILDTGFTPTKVTVISKQYLKDKEILWNFY